MTKIFFQNLQNKKKIVLFLSFYSSLNPTQKFALIQA